MVRFRGDCHFFGKSGLDQILASAGSGLEPDTWNRPMPEVARVRPVPWRLHPDPVGVTGFRAFAASVIARQGAPQGVFIPPVQVEIHDILSNQPGAGPRDPASSP